MPTIINSQAYVANLSTSTSLKRDVAARTFGLKPVTPFVMFLSKLKKDKPTGSYKHEWFNQDKKPRTLTVNGALTAADTTLVVDTPQGSYLQIGSLVQIPATGEVVRITAALSATAATMDRTYTSTAAGAIADNEEIKLLHETSPEGGTIKSMIHLMEENCYNYLQKMRTPVELTRRAARMVTYVDAYRARLRGIKSIEHQEIKENNFLFGERHNETATSVTLMGGLLWFIKTFTGSTRTWTVTVNVTDGLMSYNEFVDYAAEDIFKYGSKNKLLLAGANMMKAMNTWYGGKLEMMPNAKVFGLPMHNMLVPFGDGRLNTALESAFSGPTHKTYAAVIDLDYVAEVPGEKLHLEKDIGLKSTHVFQDEWVEDCTLRVANPKTHFLITKIAGGST